MRRMVLRVDYQEGVRISEDAQAIAIRVMVDGYHWREIKVSEKVLLMIRDSICEFLTSKP